LSASEVLKIEDKYFKAGVVLSVGAHLTLLLLFLLNLFFVKTPALDLSQAIRVDMVGLPDKVDHGQLPAKVQEKPSPAPPPAEVVKKETKLPEKTKAPTPVDSTAVDLKKAKNKQKEALEKLKKLSAIDKIKQEMKAEDQQNKIHEVAAKAIAKGRVISPGTALTGLDKIEANDYLQAVDQQVKQQWALPQWLINKPFKAKVHVKFNGNGEIISRVIMSSSGDNAYDNYCLQAVDKAAPFPKVPEKFTEKFSVDGVVIGFPE
jgi:colicin import membrane protein